jgi:hypothetical protein
MTLDMRTRVDADRPTLDPDTFFRSILPEAVAANADCVLPALSFIEPRRMTVEVDGDAWTLSADDGNVSIAPGGDDGARAYIRLELQQLDDLVNDQATFMSMWAANKLDQRAGAIGHCLDWWLVWRAALDGTPIYTPGSIEFTALDGSPLDLTRTFRIDDDPAEMQNFIEQAGFMHLTGVWSADEMGEISRDMDAAQSQYTEGDGKSWWARTAEGNTRLVRMQGFDTHSPATADLLADSRWLSLANIPGAGHVQRTNRAWNRIEALFKPIGVTEGISDIPWHKDCGIGRHSYECCGLTTGISVTGADNVSGQLHAMAGSHRALVWSGILQPDLDLPDIPLATQTGDVTLHLSCTMHMAQPPVERERRVMYSGFALPPLAGVSDDARAAGRARLGAVREGAPLTVLDKHFKS